MSESTPAPAPARMVSVDAELLMRLSGHAQALSYTDTTHGQRGTAAKDAELALAALTTPAPQAGEVGGVLELVAEFVDASRALDAAEAHLRAGTPFRPSELRNPIVRRFAANAALEALDSARLRTLAQSPAPAPAGAQEAGLRAGVEALLCGIEGDQAAYEDRWLASVAGGEEGSVFAAHANARDAIAEKLRTLLSSQPAQVGDPQ